MNSQDTPSSWHDLVKKRTKDPNFISNTCKIYNSRAHPPSNDLQRSCCCGRLVRRHSFDGKSLQKKTINGQHTDPFPPETFNSNHHASSVPVTIFGRLESNGCKFIRINDQLPIKYIYDLLVDDCGGEKHKPSFILGVYGGAKYFTMTEKLEKEIIRGIIDAATTAGK